VFNTGLAGGGKGMEQGARRSNKKKKECTPGQLVRRRCQIREGVTASSF